MGDAGALDGEVDRAEEEAVGEEGEAGVGGQRAAAQEQRLEPREVARRREEGERGVVHLHAPRQVQPLESPTPAPIFY